MTPAEVVNGSSGTTLSPWIYSEIAMTRLIRRRTPNQHRGMVKKTLEKSEVLDSLKVIYEINLDHLTDLNLDDLNKWGSALDGKAHALDVLYKLKGTEA